MTKPVNYLINSLTGLEGEPGVFYNYILAVNGLYLRAKNPQLEVTVCIAPQVVRGLAPLKEEIQLLHGKIPLYFLNLALSILCLKAGYRAVPGGHLARELQSECTISVADCRIGDV